MADTQPDKQAGERLVRVPSSGADLPLDAQAAPNNVVDSRIGAAEHDEVSIGRDGQSHHDASLGGALDLDANPVKIAEQGKAVGRIPQDGNTGLPKLADRPFEEIANDHRNTNLLVIHGSDDDGQGNRFVSPPKIAFDPHKQVPLDFSMFGNRKHILHPDRGEA